MTEEYMEYNVSKKLNGWSINSTGYEIVIFEDVDMGRCLVLEGMKVAAKVVFVDNLVRVATLEGYAVQIDYSEKIVSVLKEAN